MLQSRVFLDRYEYVYVKVMMDTTKLESGSASRGIEADLESSIKAIHRSQIRI